MLTNLLYSEEQLIEEGIEEYLKRVLILIQRNEIRRTREKTILEYEKTNKGNFLKTIWEHKENSIELDEFNKKKRKCFKCEKVSYIQRFCRSKENLSKEKKDILAIFEKSENENVLKKKKNQTRNFNYFFSIVSRLLRTDSTKRETDRHRNIYNRDKRKMNKRK